MRRASAGSQDGQAPGGPWGAGDSQDGRPHRVQGRHGAVEEVVFPLRRRYRVPKPHVAVLLGPGGDTSNSPAAPDSWGCRRAQTRDGHPGGRAAPTPQCGGQALLCWWDEALLLHLPEDLARPKATAGHCREWDRLDHRSGRFQEGSTSFLLPSIVSRGFLSTQAPTRTWAARQHPRRPADSAPPAHVGSSLPRPSQGPGLPGPPLAPQSPPEALPLIGAQVIVQPVFESLVRGAGGVLQLARGSAMEGQRSEADGVGTRPQDHGVSGRRRHAHLLTPGSSKAWSRGWLRLRLGG